MGIQSKFGVGDEVSLKLTKSHAARVAICSDVHLEFGTIELKNPGNVDILILAGDICVAKDLNDYDSLNIVGENNRSQVWHRFFQTAAAEFKHVLYIAGNHEHYHGDFATTIPRLREKLSYIKNLHVMDRDVFEFNGIRFIGSTLWTDMNKSDPLTLFHMKSCMNDFRCVENSNKTVSYKTFLPNPHSPGDQIVQFKERPATFSAEDAVEEHEKALGYIKHVYEDTPPWTSIVVIGHHTPSHQSCHPRYKEDQLMNGGYHSDLEQFILDRPGIKMWIHGHTHERYDYMIGDTRIVCNPRGYIKYEEIANTFELKVVEI